LGAVSDDPIYSHSHRQGSAASTQPQSLNAWVQTLPVGASGHRTVDVYAHASFEGDDAKGELNSNLSQRRLDVTRGLLRQADSQLVIGNGGAFLGHQEARDAGRISQPRDNPDGSPNPDRVARIRGSVGGQQVSITATIGRDAATPTPTPNPPVPPTEPPGPTTPPATTTPPPVPTGAPPTTHPPGTTPPLPTLQPPPSPIAGSPAVAFRLKFVHQEEQKTLTFEYNRQDATQRTWAPPGEFGLLLSDLKDSEKMFIEVDLDDPFFRTMAIDASMPIDFNKIALKSAHVAVDYGDPADPQNHRSSDFIFSPQDPGDKKFEFFLNKQFDTTYRYGVDFNFDPQAPWTASTFSYHFGPTPTDNRNLFVNPYEKIGFLEVTLFPHQVDPAVVDSIDVAITPVKPDLTPAGPEKLFHVLPDSPEQVYRFRSDDPTVVSYLVKTTTLLKDGTSRDKPPRLERASQLPINDPFDDALEIELVPLFDAATVKTVFIDVEYHDDANNYHRRERIVMEGNAQRQTLRLALMSKDLRAFRYRLTVIGTDNRIQSGAFHDTTETIVAVAEETPA
jgi:hypothetical protein